MMPHAPIKHIWFDLGGTINPHSPEFQQAHDELIYKTFSEVKGKPASEELKEEYLNLYSAHGSHSAAFSALGLPAGFWQERFSALDKTKFYEPDERIYKTLEKLKDLLPISLFTNLSPREIDRTLRLIAVQPLWFSYIVSGDDISKRKPDPEGFQKIIEKSQLPPENLLYVGDRVDADIKPAKALGMQTCLVWSESDQADYSFPNFADLLSLFT